MDIFGNAGWLVVVSKPNSEKKAEYNLKKQGFSPFLPLVKIRRMKKKKLVWELQPLFRRYLFIPYPQQWSTIRSTIGVSSVVMGNEYPAVMPHTEIERIKARSGSDGYITLVAPDKFKPGQKVKVQGGPFDDHIGIFNGNSGAGRVSALLELLGAKVTVNLSERDLIAA